MICSPFLKGSTPTSESEEGFLKMNILSNIIQNKKKEIALAKRRLSLAEIERFARSFRVKRRSFGKALRQKPIGLIAEIKLKSPSRGELTGGGFEELAKLYAKSGASAISVLTDKKYFNGSIEYLAKVRNICRQPILRKDFIIDEYQVYESVLAGADALLLIVAALTEKKLEELLALTEELGLDALVEAHSESELQRAIKAGATIIGINNRNLKTLSVDLATTEKLMRFAPKGNTYVGESGISTKADVLRVKAAGVHAILVGSSIVTAPDRSAKIRELSLRQSYSYY